MLLVYLICKRRSTARNVIKMDTNPLYGSDPEEVICSEFLFYFVQQESKTGSAAREESNKGEYDYMGE